MHQMTRNTWPKGGVCTYLTPTQLRTDWDYLNVPILIKYPPYPGGISIARSGGTIWCRLAPISMTFAKYRESAAVSEMATASDS
jgi:hypothetical protein